MLKRENTGEFRENVIKKTGYVNTLKQEMSKYRKKAKK